MIFSHPFDPNGQMMINGLPRQLGCRNGNYTKRSNTGNPHWGHFDWSNMKRGNPQFFTPSQVLGGELRDIYSEKLLWGLEPLPESTRQKSLGIYQ